MSLKRDMAGPERLVREDEAEEMLRAPLQTLCGSTRNTGTSETPGPAPGVGKTQKSPQVAIVGLQLDSKGP